MCADVYVSQPQFFRCCCFCYLFRYNVVASAKASEGKIKQTTYGAFIVQTGINVEFFHLFSFCNQNKMKTHLNGHSGCATISGHIPKW